MRVRGVAVAVAAAVVFTGCPSFSALGLARPIRRGSVQVAIAPEIGRVTVSTLSGAPQAVIIPQGELAVRYGVTDSFELGAKVWLLGAGLEGKLALLTAPTMRSGVDVAVGPQLAYQSMSVSPAGGGPMVSLTLPAQVGFNFGGNQLVVTPKVVDQLQFTSAGNSNSLYAGGSVGFAVKLSDDFRVMPELTAIYPLASQSAAASAFAGMSGVVLQGGVAVLIGGRYERVEAVVPDL